MISVRDKVTPEVALERVGDALGSKAENLKLNFGQVDLHCKPEDLVQVMETLRDQEGLRCRYFTFLSAIDRSEFGDEETRGGYEVLCHVYSPEHIVHVNVHVPLEGDEPVCPSITSVYRGSEWHEREAHEMFGIDFEGHPRLVNLYLPEDFEGHPLRKSFRLPSRFVKSWPGAKDPEEAAGGGRA